MRTLTILWPKIFENGRKGHRSTCILDRDPRIRIARRKPKNQNKDKSPERRRNARIRVRETEEGRFRSQQLPLSTSV